MNEPRLQLTYDGKCHELTPASTPFSIGRLPENQLCLEKGYISGRHGRIEFSEGQFSYRDLGSTNGTYLSDTTGAASFLKNEIVDLPSTGSLAFGHPNKTTVQFAIQPAGAGESMDMSDAIAALKNKQYEKAGKWFEERVATQPGNAAAYYYAGFCAAAVNDLSKAMVRFEQYRLLRPDDARVWADLGRIYERDGRMDEAIVCYRNASNLLPGLAAAQQGLERLSRSGLDPSHGMHAFSTEQLVGDQPETISNIPHFTVTWYPGHHLDILKCILKTLETGILKLRTLVGFTPKEKIPVWIQPDTGSAAGRTSSHGILLKVGGVHRRDTDFLTVLTIHETAHFALGTITGFSPAVPWWLHEGFAQQISDPIDKNRHHRMASLKRMATADALFPLAALENDIVSIINGDIPNRVDAQDRAAVIDTAYLQAHAAVAYLFDRYGGSGVEKVVSSLAGRRTIDDAFHCLGTCHETFENDFKLWVLQAAGGSNAQRTEKFEQG